MRGKIKILILCLLYCTGCQVNEEKTITKYGMWEEEKFSDAVIIDATEYQQFDSLYKRVHEIVCSDSIPFIQVETKDEVRQIKLINPCWENTVSLHIRRRNVLRIVNDKIEYYLDDYPWDSLDSLVINHYTNYGKLENLSEKPTKAIVSINYSNYAEMHLDKLLLDITNAFDQLNIDEPLSVLLEENRLPPPPPPHIGQ